MISVVEELGSRDILQEWRQRRRQEFRMTSVTASHKKRNEIQRQECEVLSYPTNISSLYISEILSHSNLEGVQNKCRQNKQYFKPLNFANSY